VLTGPPAQFLRQLQAVDGVDPVKEGDDVLDLVGLQMADHVPLDRLPDGGNFFPGFLNVVFAQKPDARVNGLPDALGLHGFGNRHQPDACGVAPGARRGRGHAVADRPDVVGNLRCHRLFPPK